MSIFGFCVSQRNCCALNMWFAIPKLNKKKKQKLFTHQVDDVFFFGFRFFLLLLLFFAAWFCFYCRRIRFDAQIFTMLCVVCFHSFLKQYLCQTEMIKHIKSNHRSFIIPTNWHGNAINSIQMILCHPICVSIFYYPWLSYLNWIELNR